MSKKATVLLCSLFANYALNKYLIILETDSRKLTVHVLTLTSALITT